MDTTSAHESYTDLLAFLRFGGSIRGNGYIVDINNFDCSAVPCRVCPYYCGQSASYCTCLAYNYIRDTFKVERISEVYDKYPELSI